MILARFFDRIVRRGVLTVVEADGTVHRFGTPDPMFRDVTVRFADKTAPGFILRNPRLGAGEAYVDGRLIVEGGDLLDLIRLIQGNAPWEAGRAFEDRNVLRDAIQALAGRVDRLNWARRSRRNVAHHYDLSDAFYALFLDEGRQYSCAYFRDPSDSLEAAQEAKLRHIAAKLALRPGMRVLDIGCGWGGLARHLHRHHGVEVLGITLSETQLDEARRRADADGMADAVRFELRDYRAVRGRFDRIVSVGMFEHVGPPEYRRFFGRCRSLLEEDGTMLLHTIGRLGGPGTVDAWTRKYIFPGGTLPALSEIVAASQRARLIATDVETLRLHYALTLGHWYRRFVAARAQVEAMHDARLFRMWRFYLAGALVAFESGGLCNYQVQFARNRRALPITRDYMLAADTALTA